MKNIFSFAAIFLSLLFLITGCSSFSGKSVFMQMNYSLTGTVEHNGEKSQLLVKHTTGEYRITYQEPSTISGLEECYTMDENGEWKISLTYEGLTESIENSSVLQSSVGSGIVASLQDASTKNSRETSGVTKEGSYTLTVDSDGYPSKLSMPQEDLTVSFSVED